MHDSRFDALTRTFTESRSRRGLLRLLVGAAFAGRLAMLGLAEGSARRKNRKGHARRKRGADHGRDRTTHRGAEVQADKKKGSKKKPCPPCRTRKQGKCKGRKPDGSACPGGTCRAGSCLPTSQGCTPKCADKVCGDNGCGGNCGTCAGDLSCQNGQCVLNCDSGLTPCAGNCVDLQTDENHCGTCETACTGGRICQAGTCGCPPATPDTCGAACVDLTTDGDNCGTCGNRCSFPHASATCQTGSCAMGACDPGFASCDGTGQGCELDTRADLANCGACRNRCTAPPNATATCTNSTCGFSCNAGFHDCGGSCVSDSDPAHCGTSCEPCPSSVCSPATCTGTTCGRAPVPECCEGDGDCGDSNACTIDTCGADHTCRHTNVVCTSNDPCQNPICDPSRGCTTVDHCPPDQVCIAESAQRHCCPQSRPLWDGTQCAECTPTDLNRCAAPPPNATASCTAQGSCSFTCLPNWGDCEYFSAGCETNLRTNTAHCGGCRQACASGQICLDGVCGVVCSSGFCAVNSANPDCCGTTCTNTLTDSANCGTCGHACAGGEQCGAVTCCSGLQPTDNLQAAIDAANPGATLRLCPGTWELTQTVVIDKDLALIGAGAGQTILDGGDAVRVLAVIWPMEPRPNVTVRGLTITKGKTSGHGGGILNHGTLMLRDVLVTSNTATNAMDPLSSSGGGIHNRGTLTLVRTSVTGNSADWAGGGIVSSSNDTLLQLALEAGTSVTGNTAIFGAGISNGGPLTLKAGSSVTGNTARKPAPNSAFRGVGGGINNSGRLTLKAGSSVTGNTADEGGGVANSFGGQPTIEATDIVTGNHLTDGTTVSNCAPVDTIPNCIG